METVTIIIPNYNHASFFKERIDSVLNQTYQNFEIIILDDCSTDSSLAVIEQYRNHPKISYIIYNEENSGSTFRQWEKGLLLAKGSWIWIAESDDVSSLDFLEHLMIKANESENISLVYSASLEIDEFGHVIKRNDWADSVLLDAATKNRFGMGKDEIKNHFYSKNIIPNASATVFKKKHLNMSIFRLIENMKFAGDWLFWVSILENSNICFVAKELNYFRCHSSSTREIKSVELERKRFGEYLFILNYIKNRYSLLWDIKKHYWLLDEWKWKFADRGNVFKELFFYSDFPFFYRTEIIYRIIIEKLTYFFRK